MPKPANPSHTLPTLAGAGLPPAETAQATLPATISAENLRKVFTTSATGLPWAHRKRAKSTASFTAVKSIGFKVRPGQCTGLLGPNGAGKTTTMRLLMGLTPRSSGTLTIFGTDVTQLTQAQRQKISLVPQDDNLDPDLTVTENLLIYGRFFDIPLPELKQRVPQLLADMQLTDKAHSRVNQLSGGMKRRLTIARALINDPDLIILDEPTTGLDPQARVLIWQRLLDLKKQGKTILISTHYMDEAQRLCDHIVLIDNGEVLTEGTPQILIQHHVRPHVFDVSKPVPPTLKGNLSIMTGTQEDIGDSVLFYVDDAAAFRRALPDDARFLQRPANMEDVFLQLTGRRLRN